MFCEPISYVFFPLYLSSPSEPSPQDMFSLSPFFIQIFIEELQCPECCVCTKNKDGPYSHGSNQYSGSIYTGSSLLSRGVFRAHRRPWKTREGILEEVTFKLRFER